MGMEKSRARSAAFGVLGLCLSGLAGCGGGGGGSGGGSSSTLAAVDANNAAPVSRDVIRSSIASSTIAAGLGNDAVVSGEGAMAARVLGAASTTALPRAARAAAAAPEADLALGPEVVACEQSGTVRLSGNVASEVTLSPGDRLTAEFDACDDGLGVVLDGRARFTVTSFSGDILGNAFEGVFGLVLTDLRATTGADSFTVDGEASLDLDVPPVPARLVATIYGPRLSVTEGSETWRLDDFSTTTGFDYFSLSPGVLVPSPVELSTTGSLSGPGFSGRVDFVTVTPFRPVFEIGGPETWTPGVGELRISGANNASILVQGLGAADVRLAVDADGDNLAETTIDTTWSALID
jgi:hypothetical protein